MTAPWLYMLLAFLCCAGYGLLGYLGHKTYKHISEGRNR